MEGWIKLHRKTTEWGWYQDSKTVHLFLHLLLRANHEPGEWMGVKIGRGQLVTGRKKLSIETGISETSIRTRLKWLKSTNEITIKSTNDHSLITICNYDDYQKKEDKSDQQTNQQSNQQLTSNQPATNQQLTTNKNEKNEKNEKNGAGFLFSEFHMTLDELRDRYFKKHPTVDFKYYYERAGKWSMRYNERKKDWFLTILSWINSDIKKNELHEVDTFSPQHRIDLMKYFPEQHTQEYQQLREIK